MRSQRAQIRRVEILAAALAEVSARGISALRVADVAAVLGISSGLVFYHFDSKEKLIAETFRFAADHDLQELDEILRRPEPVAARLGLAATQYGPSGDAHGWRIWIEGWSEAERNDHLRETIERLNDAWLDGLIGLIHEGVGTGEFTVDDPDVAATHILALLDGTGVRAALWPANPRTAALRGHNVATIQRALGMTDEAARQFAGHFDGGAYAGDAAPRRARS